MISSALPASNSAIKSARSHVRAKRGFERSAMSLVANKRYNDFVREYCRDKGQNSNAVFSASRPSQWKVVSGIKVPRKKLAMTRKRR